MTSTRMAGKARRSSTIRDRAMTCPFCHAYRFDGLPHEACPDCGAMLQGDLKTVERVETVRLRLGGDGLRACCRKALRCQRGTTCQ